MPSRQTAAFTLIELTVVVLIMSLLAAAVFRYSTQSSNATNTAALNKTLDVIETALQNYRNTNTRLPCPSNITLAENLAMFGIEVGTVGDGNCTGYNFGNHNDPDEDPDNIAGDPDYDASTSGQVVAGGIPTKTLKIDDKYAYDPWGRKILFVVDKRATATNAFTTNTISNSVIGAVVVKRNSTDTLANAITYKGIYALVSFGANGHGGYSRNPNGTSIVMNNSSTNINEQKNCHCNSAAVSTAFDRTFVQAPKNMTTALTNIFDDVVRVKTRAQLASYSELQ